MLFHKTITKEPKETPVDMQWKKKIRIGLLVSAFLILLAVPCIELGSIANHISANWVELRFTYEHPQFVKVIHQRYDEQQKQLEQTFSQKQQSAQDNLLNAVANELDSKK